MHKIGKLQKSDFAWKACKRLKRFGGSNPPLSAMIFRLLAKLQEV